MHFRMIGTDQTYREFNFPFPKRDLKLLNNQDSFSLNSRLNDAFEIYDHFLETVVKCSLHIITLLHK